jgi:hypothetical protein
MQGKSPRAEGALAEDLTKITAEFTKPLTVTGSTRAPLVSAAETAKTLGIRTASAAETPVLEWDADAGGMRFGTPEPARTPPIRPTAEQAAQAWEQALQDDPRWTETDQTDPNNDGTTEASNTDDGNALRLVNTHGHEIRRVADMRRWHHWDGQRWVKDDEGRTVRQYARELARQLPTGGRNASKFKYVSMSSAGLTACVRVAETDPRVSILASDLDAHPELINTPTGVVNLRTGKVQPHNPALLLTRITNYGANLEAAHPTWDAFLTETFNGDQELISYMQKLFGPSTTRHRHRTHSRIPPRHRRQR